MLALNLQMFFLTRSDNSPCAALVGGHVVTRPSNFKRGRTFTSKSQPPPPDEGGEVGSRCGFETVTPGPHARREYQKDFLHYHQRPMSSSCVYASSCAGDVTAHKLLKDIEMELKESGTAWFSPRPTVMLHGAEMHASFVMEVRGPGGVLFARGMWAHRPLG